MRARALLAVLLTAVVTLAFSPNQSAPTPAAFPRLSNSVRFAVIGDMGSGKKPQMDLAKQMVTSRAGFPFALVLTVGDNIYPANKASDLERAFAFPYKPLLDAGVLFYATLGNHDDS